MLVFDIRHIIQQHKGKFTCNRFVAEIRFILNGVCFGGKHMAFGQSQDFLQPGCRVLIHPKCMFT